MIRAMLGLGRVGGGSGWLLGLRWHGRWCAEGDGRVPGGTDLGATSSFPPRKSAVSLCAHTLIASERKNCYKIWWQVSGGILGPDATAKSGETVAAIVWTVASVLRCLER